MSLTIYERQAIEDDIISGLKGVLDAFDVEPELVTDIINDFERYLGDDLESILTDVMNSIYSEAYDEGYDEGFIDGEDNAE